jgi:hypothetical protein
VTIDDTIGGKLSFISAEDLCLHKVLFGRDKDVTDLEALLARRPSIDLAYVRGWLTRMVPAGDPRLYCSMISNGDSRRARSVLMRLVNPCARR